MIGAIMAGGRGERLRSLGPSKPLIEVGGTPLLTHVWRQLADAEVAEIIVDVNARDLGVRELCEALAASSDIPVQFVHGPSHGGTGSAVRAILSRSHGASTLVSTVDTVAPPQAYAKLASAALAHGSATMILATTLIQDDHPIYVHTHGLGHIRAVTDIGKQIEESSICFGNVRFFQPDSIAEILALPVVEPESDLSFLRHLLSTPHGVDALILDPIFDIDDETDVDSAAAWLGRGSR